jgi:hypothetical protein
MEDKSHKTIADYIGDVVALESHIEEALDRQLGLTNEDPVAGPAVREFHTLVKGNRDRMRSLQDSVGSTAGNPIKEIGSSLLGKAAGMIDKIRTEGISKALRDDYTAFNMAAISYTMLHTTAVALKNDRVASVAEQNLTGYAAAIQQINRLIPKVVVSELAKDGHQVAAEAPASTVKIVQRAWKSTSDNH